MAETEDATSSIAFGEKLLGLLDTGSFTTSYKYALLLAILDQTLERTASDGSPPTVLSARELGARSSSSTGGRRDRSPTPVRCVSRVSATSW